MAATRLTLASLLGFTLLADGAALAGTAEAGGSAPSPLAAPSPSPVSVAPQSAATYDPWRKGSSAIALNFGAGSAVGFAGLTYSYLPLPMLETEAGIGMGYSGAEFSAMQKMVVGHGRTRFVAGIGLALSLPSTHEHAFWLNLDLIGFEMRTKNQLVFFMSGGLTYLFGQGISFRSNDDCVVSPPCPAGDNMFPQLRIGLGKAF